MTAGILIAIALAAATALWLGAPLLRDEKSRAVNASEELGEARELQSEQEMLLASLRDLEDDRESDKLDETDYETLKASLSARAVGVMKRLDDMDRRRAEEEERSRPRPLLHPKARLRGPEA